jgi:hypothetical protein
LLASCGRPDVTPAAPADPGAAFERQAAQVAQNWRATGLSEAWTKGLVPIQGLTIEPAAGFPNDAAKSAAMAGWYRLKTALPDKAGTGTVRFPDGSTLATPLVGAATAYRALAQGEPSCPAGTASPAPEPSKSAGPDGSVSSPAQPCAWLTVKSAKLGSVQLRTSRGVATVPAWLFEVAEMSAPMIRVAVAPAAISPLPPVPEPARRDVPGLVSTQGLIAVGERNIDYKLGVGACDSDIRPLVWESSDVIVIGGSVRPPSGDQACISLLKLEPVAVKLTSPVGSRIILDALTGQPVVQEPRW